MNIGKISLQCLITLIVLSGCVSNPEKMHQKSFLTNSESDYGVVTSESQGEETTDTKSEGNSKPASSVNYIQSFKSTIGQQNTENDALSRFSDSQMTKVTADGLSIKDYLHYVLGELLNVSYVLGDGVENDQQSITLNLQESVSKRKLYSLSQEVLAERGYVIRYADQLFYIHKQQGQGNQGDTVFAYGNTVASVPDTSVTIMQMVPFNFGTQVSLASMVERFINVKATAYPQRDMMLLQGKRRDILRALEFVDIMDQPIFKDRVIAMYRPNYVSLDAIVDALKPLLDREGIDFSDSSKSTAIASVKVDRLNTLFLFASNSLLIERAVYWAEQLDKPSETEESQYFIYQPVYSRAVDLGASLQLLISDSTGIGSSTSAAAQNNLQDSPSPTAGSLVASNKNLKMVVNEQANTLIFKTTGREYKQLLPLIKRLDILPKQIGLEVMIAEVTLTDKFKQGVEFALSNGNYTAGTLGALGAAEFGGLSYVLTGANGRVTMNSFQSDSLVNVLSRPSIVVRDGFSASINVGTDIPVIGETTIDPNDANSIARTSIVYRKTGVKLNVTPTVNSMGVVTLEIEQSISSQVDDVATVSGSPAIFERSISTQVIAQDGQTVILGGLISDNNSKGTTRVPFLSSIPFIGKLFTAESRSGDKTELVVMVTPKIISSTSEWENLKRQLSSQLNYIDVK